METLKIERQIESLLTFKNLLKEKVDKKPSSRIFKAIYEKVKETENDDTGIMLPLEYGDEYIKTLGALDVKYILKAEGELRKLYFLLGKNNIEKAN